MADIVGRVRIDGSGVTAGLNQAKAGVERFSSDVKRTVAGIFSGAAFVSAIRRTIQEIDQISDVSEELNMPVEQVQALKISAMEASDSFEKLHAILTKIQDIQIDIVKGESAGGLKNRAILQQHGFSASDINKMSLTQFAQVLAKNITDKGEINQILGPRMAGKFNLYRQPLMNVDDNVAKGLDKGTIHTSNTVDEMNGVISNAKTIWGDMWNEFFGNLSSVVVALKALADYVKSLLPETKQDNTWGALFTAFMAGVNPMAFYRSQLNQKSNKTASTQDTGLNLPIGGGSTGIHTDPLVGVGNFLGQGQVTIQSAMNTLVSEAQKQTAYQRQIAGNTANGGWGG